jgi:N-acetylglutamate synthase-like GNAT family acetyltransferase
MAATAGEAKHSPLLSIRATAMPAPEKHFRRATAADAHALATLRCEQYPDASRTVAETAALIGAAFPARTAENQHTFVVSSKGAVIGACTLHVRTHVTGKRTAALHDVCVARAMRSKGHGYELVRQAMVVAAHELECCEATVLPETDRAAAFYRRLGFATHEPGTLRLDKKGVKALCAFVG